MTFYFNPTIEVVTGPFQLDVRLLLRVGTVADGAVMDVIISLGWEAVTVVHDSPGLYALKKLIG